MEEIGVKVFERSGKNLGEYKDGVLRKKVKKSVHLYVKDDAFCFDAQMLSELPEGTELRLWETEDDVIYSVSLDDALVFGKTIKYKDYGMQVSVPRSIMSSKKKL